MSKAKKVVEVIPSARKLIRALRDLGYDFSTAIAELVDNSIVAGATSVHINAFFEGDDSWVMVRDNGVGMNTKELIEAMRLGTEREEREEDLGKFGLGLKTASFSQCDLVSVISRKDPAKNEIVSYCWDLDHIDKKDRWEIIELLKDDLDPRFTESLDVNTGTVVIWQNLNRMLGYQRPLGDAAKRRMSTLCRELEEHLAMVYHRFIDGEVKNQVKLQIFLNGNQIKSWDPFARTELKTIHRRAIRIPVEYEGVHGFVRVEPYILPHQEDFSSYRAWEIASGPRRWNQQQGFYIYRENRLIQSGGWSRLRTSDEHTKLARIAMSFSKNLDDAFKINVPKMRVQIPSQIKEQIEAEVQNVVKLAQAKYRRKKPATSPPPRPPSPPVYDPPNDPPKFISENSGFHHSVEPKRVWTLDEMENELKKAAKPDERIVILNVFKRLRLELSKLVRS